MNTLRTLLITLCVWMFAMTAQAVDLSGATFARLQSAYLGLQGRLMWIDATANLDRITTREGIEDIVARCKKANITTLVLDVKPVSGHVIYNSRLAERLRTWRGKTYPEIDVLAIFVEEARKAGLEIAVSFNVFSEGHKMHNVGLGYRKPEWQSVTYSIERWMTTPGGARLRVRGSDDPETPGVSPVYGEEFLLEPTKTPGAQLAVTLDENQRITGMIDPAILGEEPLSAPDNGRLLILSNQALDWGTRHLRLSERMRFEVQGRRIPVTEAPGERVAVFVNPLHPEARRYQIALMREVAENYDVDAIVFDRMRYANLFNDYSELTRAAFERWLGKPIQRWPEDVIRPHPVPGRPVIRGPYFKPWLEFRARVIREFVRETTETIRQVKPKMQFGVYVGSWFQEYYGVGVNWGSEKFPVQTSWASVTYNEAGYAEFLDWISTGCYYPVPTRAEAHAQGRSPGGTVEASARLSSTVVANSVPVYAGLYALQYARKPEVFERALQAAADNSHGVMIFDLSYIYDYGWWHILDRVFAKPATPPHRYTDLVSQLRAAQDAVRSPRDARGSGARLPAVPYQPGGG
jgi:uncharacterized lipoprotein YddW (UPF0748 family)